MKNRNKIIIVSTIVVVSGILLFAFSKKNQSKTDNSTDKEFNDLMDKIDKAPK